MLRAIENGASLYFLLSYQNTSELKNDSVLSQYYSIRYDIWKTDVAKYYNELNAVLSDVQLKQIINHEFLKGERILDLDELRAEISNKLEAAEREEADKSKNEQIGELNSVADAWALLYGAENTAKGILNDVRRLNVSIAQALADCEAIKTLGASNTAFLAAQTTLEAEKTSVADAKTALDTANAVLKAAQAALEAADEAGKAEAEAAVTAAQADVDAKQADYDAWSISLAFAQEAYDDALAEVSEKVQNAYEALMSLLDYTIELSALKAEADTLAEQMPVAIEIVRNTDIYEDDAQMRDKLLAQMATYKANAETYLPLINSEYAVYASRLTLEDGGVFAETVNTFNAAIEGEDNEALVGVFSAYSFDMDKLTEMYASKLRNENVGEGAVAQKPADSNVVDNKRIVAVTYGTGNAAYKTFILNYNSYSVRVVYNGTVYTIASGDYVVIEYSNANA